MASYPTETNIRPTLATLKDLSALKATSDSAAAEYHKLRSQLSALRTRLETERDTLAPQTFSILQAELLQLQSRAEAAQAACEGSEKAWADAAHLEYERQL